MSFANTVRSVANNVVTYIEERKEHKRFLRSFKDASEALYLARKEYGTKVDITVDTGCGIILRQKGENEYCSVIEIGPAKIGYQFLNGPIVETGYVYATAAFGKQLLSRIKNVKKGMFNNLEHTSAK